METPYLVYLNKSYDSSLAATEIWAKRNNVNTADFSVISETIFWHWLEDGKLENVPVYFCKDKRPF